MKDSRWKLFAGVFGLSVCGIAALASSANRSGGNFGCDYRANHSVYRQPVEPTSTENHQIAAIVPITPSIPAATKLAQQANEIATLPPPLPVTIPPNTATEPAKSSLQIPDWTIPSAKAVPAIPTSQAPMLPSLNTLPVNPKADPLIVSQIVTEPLTPGKAVTKPAPVDFANSIPTGVNPALFAPANVPIPVIPSVAGASINLPPSPVDSKAATIPPIPATVQLAQAVPPILPVVPEKAKEVKLPELDLKPAANDPLLIPAPELKPSKNNVPVAQKVDQIVQLNIKLVNGVPTLNLTSPNGAFLELTCEQLDVTARNPKDDSSVIKATGKVQFKASGCTGSCDELVLNPKTMEGTLRNAVRVKCTMYAAETELTAEQMSFQLRSVNEQTIRQAGNP